jgi:hypothetical protein
MAAGFKKATVNASLVAATLSDYPTYVDLSRIGITTLAEAQSVRVYADSGKTTEWAREIVSATEMHVKVPSLTSTVEIYVDYDGVRADYAAGDTYGRNAVWSGYRTVRHLEANGSDSAGVLNNTDANLSFGAGKVGNRASFNGTSSQITTTTGGTIYGTVSLGFWFKTTDTGRSNVPFTWSFASGTTSTSSQIIVDINSGVISYTAGPTSGGGYNDGNWHKLNITQTGASGVMYVNGSSVASGSVFNLSTNNIFPRIGRSANNSFPHWFNGELDELTIVTGTQLSANWITTEYNNQNNESSFWGTWTDAGGGPVASPRGGILLSW